MNEKQQQAAYEVIAQSREPDRPDKESVIHAQRETFIKWDDCKKYHVNRLLTQHFLTKLRT